MTITYHAGRRIQGLSGEQNKYTTTTTYNNANDTVVSVRSLYSNPLISNGEGERVGVRINAGHSSIGTKVKKIKAKIAKHGTLVGNYEITIRDSNDTIKGIASATANNLTTSYTTVEHELDNVVTIETGDRISIEYDGTTRTANGLDLGTASSNWETNTTQQLYSTGGGWVNDPDGSIGRKFMFTFDSTPVTDAGGITNVQSGSRFEETDTRKIYYGALPSVTYETDFSSTTGWSLNGGSYTGISNGVYNWDILTGLNNEVRGAWYPITTADDSKWVLRFKLGIDTLTPSGSPDPDSSQLIVILSDTGANTYYPYDAIGFSFYLGGGGSWAPKFYLWGSDSYYIISPSSTAVTAYTTTPSTGTYYIELIRNSSTSVTGTIYSDSNYSTVVESKTITIPSTIQSLDNIQICVFDGNNSGSYTANGYIDDLKFYNGVTSTGFTWTEEV